MDRKPLKQPSTEHQGGHGFRGYIIVAAEQCLRSEMIILQCEKQLNKWIRRSNKLLL